MEVTKVGILGATGYVGVELVRILSGHPRVRLTRLASKSYSGQSFSSVYPAFRGINDTILSDESIDGIERDADLVITALPHGVSSITVPELLKKGVKVIDHSGDFRYRDVSVYKESYKLEHPCPELLSEAVYGIPELYRAELANTRLAANPGCYPTCSILGLAPLLKGGIISTGGIVIDAISGYSGAGRKAELSYAFCETDENFKAYSPIFHRHTTEIEQELSLLAGTDVIVTFTPHLAPIKRGMYATIYADALPAFAGLTGAKLTEIYADFYKDEPFVRILPSGSLPETRYATGSNYLDIAVTTDPRTGKIKVFSSQDNLGKGAALQAVQTLNVMMGYPEKEGLSTSVFGL